MHHAQRVPGLQAGARGGDFFGFADFRPRFRVLGAANEEREAGEGVGAVVPIPEVQFEGRRRDRAWLPIAPYGDHPHPTGIQRFDRSAAELMVKAFRGTYLGRIFRRGAPIYIGHPDIEDWRNDRVRRGLPVDDRVYGRVTALEARDSALYGLHVFNRAGAELVSGDGAAFDGTSPYWLFMPYPRGDGANTPVELVSVGLTNNPNIKTNRFALNEGADKPDPKPHEERDDDMKISTELLEKIGLTADSTDEEAEAKLGALVQRVESLEADLKKAKPEKEEPAKAKEKEEPEKPAPEEKKEGAGNERVVSIFTGIVDNLVETGAIPESARGAANEALQASGDINATMKELVEQHRGYNTAEQPAVKREGSVPTGDPIRNLEGAANEIMEEEGVDRDTAYALLPERRPELFNAADGAEVK